MKIIMLKVVVLDLLPKCLYKLIKSNVLRK